MDFEQLFSREYLSGVFPPERTNQFFDALFGDPDEGAYDIRMSFLSSTGNALNFLFELHQRGNACLACNLTHGLPHVFRRHPVIDLNGVAEALAKRAGWEKWEWELGSTEEISRALHVIPLSIKKSG